MFPKLTTITECLESLIGVRTACDTTTPLPRFFIEDIEGVDIETLAMLAKASNLSGEDFGKQLINSAAREMLGDIELLLNDGYQLLNTVGTICSTCSLLPTYTNNAGIVVKTAVRSSYQQMFITSLQILCNRTGDVEVAIDDKNVIKTFTVPVKAGVIQPIKINYKTTASQVKIYFTDATIGCGQVLCQTSSSCGCGTTKAEVPVTIGGQIAGIETAVQYGFLPCATIGCSYDSLVCAIIQATPNIFGLTLLYRVAEKYYLNKEASTRNNATASYNEEEKSQLVRNYGQLYWAKMKGTKDVQGVRNILNNFLKNSNKAKDKCIYCSSKIGVAYAAG